MATGRVKWFNNAKGYGFVRPDHGGEDLFVHYSYISMDGYKTLKAGQPVNFDVKEASKGHHAVNLTLIDEPVRDTREAVNDPKHFQQTA
ncbi:MAG: cold-shock protein [Pseudomonadota bacterium]